MMSTLILYHKLAGMQHQGLIRTALGGRFLSADLDAYELVHSRSLLRDQRLHCHAWGAGWTVRRIISIAVYITNRN